MCWKHQKPHIFCFTNFELSTFERDYDSLFRRGISVTIDPTSSAEFGARMERFHAEEGGTGEDELVSFFGQQEFLYDNHTNSMLEVAPLIAENGVSKKHCVGHPGRFLPKMRGDVVDIELRYDVLDQYDEPTMSKDDVIEDGWPESLESLSIFEEATERDLSAASRGQKSSPEGQKTQTVTPFEAFRSFVRNGRSRDGPKKINVQEPLPQSRDEHVEELPVPSRSSGSDRLEALEKEVNAAAAREGVDRDSDQDFLSENRVGTREPPSPHHFVPLPPSDDIPILSRMTQLESAQSAASTPPLSATMKPSTEQGFLPVAATKRAFASVPLASTTIKPSTEQGFLPVAATKRVSPPQTPTTSNRSFVPVSTAGLAVAAMSPTVTRSSAAAVQRFQPVAISGRTRSSSLESSMGVSGLYPGKLQGKSRSDSVDYPMGGSQLYPGMALGKQHVNEMSITPQRRVTRKDQVLAQRKAEKAAPAARQSKRKEVPAPRQSKRTQRGFGRKSRQENNKGKTTEKKTKVQNKNLDETPKKNNLLGRLRRGRSMDKLPGESVIATFPVVANKHNSSKKSTKGASKDVDPFVILGIAKPPRETKEDPPRSRQRTRSLGGMFRKSGDLERKPSLTSSTSVMGNTTSGTVSTRALSPESSLQICSRSVFSLSSDQGKEGTAPSEKNKNSSSKSVFSRRKQPSRSNNAKTTSVENKKSESKSVFSLSSDPSRSNNVKTTSPESQKSRSNNVKTTSPESQKSASKSVFSLSSDQSRSSNAKTTSPESQQSASKSVFSLSSDQSISNNAMTTSVANKKSASKSVFSLSSDQSNSNNTKTTSVENKKSASKSVFSLSSDQSSSNNTKTTSVENKKSASKSVFSLSSDQSRSNNVKTTSPESKKSESKAVFSLSSDKGKEKNASIENAKSARKSVFSLGKGSSRSTNAKTTSAESKKSASKSTFTLRSASGTAAAAAAVAASRSKAPVKKGRAWGSRIRSLDTFFKKNRKLSDKGAMDTSLHGSETSSIWRMIGEDDASHQTKGSLLCSSRKEEPEVGVIESFIESLFDYALDDWDSDSSDYSSDNEASFSSLSSHGRFRRSAREEQSKPKESLSSISELVTGAFGGSWL